MKLHVFNPEHDTVLAAKEVNFTAPHAARQLRMELGFLPALWANDGDMVLVDDVAMAKAAVRKVKRPVANVLFVDIDSIATNLTDSFDVEPWGWDYALKKQLSAASEGIATSLPTDDELEKIRQMSNRRFAADKLLKPLLTVDERFVGESRYYSDLQTVVDAVTNGGRWVIKSPWSSSGRGLRYVDNDFSNHTLGWCRNVINVQGGLMIEPYYNKVADFGMEFMAHGDGRIEYVGLSVFATYHGAYVGNVLATERAKREMLSRYVDLSLLDMLQKIIVDILHPYLSKQYRGAFGVDMMIVANDDGTGFKVHPCVEMNLRRTMGHAAIALSGDESLPQALMDIHFDGHYHLRVCDTNENIVNTSLFI